MQDDVPVQTDFSATRSPGNDPPSTSNVAEAVAGPGVPDRPPFNFRILALLWLFVSLPAIYLLLREPAWLRASGVVEWVRAVRFEQWVAGALLGIQVWLGFRVWRSGE